MSNISRVKEASSVNQTEALNSSECGHVDTSSNTFFILGYSLVLLVGVVLNSFTMRIYLCQAQKATSSRMMVYLRNLAAADFLICLSLPLYIANYASSSITLHRFYCNFGPAAFYLNMCASIIFMGYIAANRYVQIIHPLGTSALRSVRAANILSAVTWVFLLLAASAFITLFLVNQEPLMSALDNCDVLLNAQTVFFYKILYILTSTMFLFVLISLLFFYYSISRKVSLAQQSQPASSDSSTLLKSRKNMSVLVSVFCVCFIPYHMVRLPYVFLWTKCPMNQVFYYLLEFSRFTSVLNVCLDPVLYIILCKGFRSQLKLMMQRLNRENNPQVNLNTININ